MNSKPLSQDEFQAKKQEALQNEPVARQVPLSSIELTDNSYKDGVVKVGGKTVSASKDFFAKLGGILHISDDTGSIGATNQPQISYYNRIRYDDS